MESERRKPNQLQDVANIKQNHDEQITDEREDLHTETRPEQYANWETELLQDEGDEYTGPHFREYDE